MWLLDVCVGVHNTPACSQAERNKNACKRPGGVGLCMPQLEISQPPSCHVHVMSPRPADADASSLHQHEPH